MNMIELLNQVSSFLIPVAHAAEEVAHAESASPGVLGALGINWKLFIAQLINFSIVLFVLSKYVFGPISKKLAERTEKIDVALKDAEKIEQEKIEFNTWKDAEITKARKEASEIINKSQAEAQKLKENLLSQTKIEQEKLVTQAKALISDEEKKMISEVKHEVADMVTKASEKIIRKKLDTEADKKLIQESLNNLQ
jgi:F-type H+-transporting ATPase subunit b